MACAQTWWRIGPALAMAGWQTVALDLPGHGSGPRLAGRPDLGRLVKSMGDGLPARIDVLVGHSLGAVVALMLADRTRALVLEDPPDGVGGDHLIRQAAVLADIALERQHRDAMRSRFRAVNPDWADQDVEYAVDGILAADAAGLAAALEAGVSWDLAALVAATGVPTMVLAPPAAPGGALAATRSMVREFVGDERFVEVDGGHCPHRSRPERWLAVVSAFLDAVLIADGGTAS